MPLIEFILMIMITRIAFPLLILFISLAGCQEDSDNPGPNYLEGLVGDWKLGSRSVNNITPLIIECCDELRLKEDQNLQDFRGDFLSTGTSHSTEGDFKVDRTLHKIFFYFDDRELEYNFDLGQDVLIFSYLESGNEIEEHWGKQ